MATPRTIIVNRLPPVPKVYTSDPEVWRFMNDLRDRVGGDSGNIIYDAAQDGATSAALEPLIFALTQDVESRLEGSIRAIIEQIQEQNIDISGLLTDVQDVPFLDNPPDDIPYGAIIQASIDNASVRSVFGRTGLVVAAEGDYTLTQLGDVTLSAPALNQVLVYNGSGWVNGPAASTPGGSTTQVQYNNAGAFAGATNVTIQSNDIAVATATPSASSAGTAKMSVTSIANRLVQQTTGPNGWTNTLNPFRARHQQTGWFPAGNSTTVELMASQALSATGTATQAVVATTNIHTKMKRIDYLVTVAAANAVAGWRYAPTTASGQHWIDGGFHYVCRWGPGTGQATATTRSFTGLAISNVAPTDVEPDTLVSIIGCGWRAADANIHIFHNDAAGTATPINLGASFPVPAADYTAVYELALFAAPGATTVDYQFTNVGTGATATGNLSSDLPSTTGLLLPRSWMSVGGTNSVIGITLMSCYIESAF